MELLKLLDIKLVISHIVCFLLVLWLLKKFMWKPVFVVLEARKNRLAADFEAIETAKADVARLKSEYELFLAKVEDQARARLKEAVAQGEFNAQEIREKARLEAIRIVEEGKNDVAHELAKTRNALKTEVVGLVMSITEKFLAEKLSFDSDRQLVEAMIADLDKPE